MPGRSAAGRRPSCRGARPTCRRSRPSSATSPVRPDSPQQRPRSIDTPLVMPGLGPGIHELIHAEPRRTRRSVLILPSFATRFQTTPPWRPLSQPAYVMSEESAGQPLEGELAERFGLDDILDRVEDAL